jgi:hypothetical protein
MNNPYCLLLVRAFLLCHLPALTDEKYLLGYLCICLKLLFHVAADSFVVRGTSEVGKYLISGMSVGGFAHILG